MIRRQQNWPPKENKRINDNRYSICYNLPDRNFLMMRWVDPGEVDMVTTVPDGYEKVLKRKRPRENDKYRNRIRTVWRNEWGVDISIPQVIGDYDNNMGDFDKANMDAKVS
jgi:hypothetical protein